MELQHPLTSTPRKSFLIIQYVQGIADMIVRHGRRNLKEEWEIVNQLTIKQS
jgi:hypothetical protein